MKRLYLIRGLPGSGKTTLAKRITEDSKGYYPDYYEADQYFQTQGGYEFDRFALNHAHANCQERVEAAMEQDVDTLAVSNTFSKQWEMQAYKDLAKHYGYYVVTIDLFDGGMTTQQLFERNVHNVPLETIEKMKARWEK